MASSPVGPHGLIRFAAATILLVAARAYAVTIDDFSAGPIALERTGATPVTALQTGLDPAHVLGGRRDIALGSSGAAGQTVMIDADAQRLRFTTTTSLGYLRISYGSTTDPLGVDLLADRANAFVLDFEYPTPLAGRQAPFIFIAVQTPTQGGNTSTGRVPLDVQTLPDGSKRVKFPFSWLNGSRQDIDFSNVSAIHLDLVRIAVAESPVVIRRFATVPEPTSALLLAVGAIALRRRPVRIH